MRQLDAQLPGKDTLALAPAASASAGAIAAAGARARFAASENQDRGPAHGAYAAIDLGTNNCRLLIAEPRRHGFRVIDAFSRIVRLGEGLSRTGAISDAAMERTVAALGICRDKIMNRKVARARLIATEACRVASNSRAFLERVRSETGLKLEIVDAATEARLAVSGSASLIDPSADGVLIFDIGGGSTELIWLDLSQQERRSPLTAHRRIAAWTSVPLGVVNLAETYGGRAVTRESFEAMVAAVSKAFAHFPGVEKGRAALEAGRRVHLLGTSGTVTTLAGIGLGLERYDRRKVDGVWFDVAAMRAISETLLAQSFEERQLNKCIGSDRADLVLPGCAVLEAICRAWPCTRLRVADRGLREGILMTLMAEDGVWRHRNRPSAGRDALRSEADATKAGAT